MASDTHNFRFPPTTRGESLGLAGVPHPLGLRRQHGCLWFALVDTPSPALLGLDFSREAEPSVTRDGLLVCADGHREGLTGMKVDTGDCPCSEDSDSK